jgi:hypothetical protein
VPGKFQASPRAPLRWNVAKVRGSEEERPLPLPGCGPESGRTGSASLARDSVHKEQTVMSIRPGLDEIGLGTGKKSRLHRILFQHGLGNGTAIFLPYDQGLEHGPRDFFPNPMASDPRYIVKLAIEGGLMASPFRLASPSSTGITPARCRSY